jgi:hypothetical protein
MPPVICLWSGSLLLFLYERVNSVKTIFHVIKLIYLRHLDFVFAF